MSLETVVEAILENGKAEAQAILSEARAERERMLGEARSEGAKAMAEAEERARTTAERRRVQALARAELEARKIVLGQQREALDRVYRGTLERLGSLPENAEFLRTLLKANESEWRGGGKVFSNAHDEAAVRKIVGSAFAGTIDCAGGVVIESADGTRRVDLRYESILRDVWDDAVKEVAETLWPPKG
ncbi:MAG TPA: V-type ATP synthase subunit E family protein [Thermoplasmata archaeon]|nr:V-type ATP synthase subunit E family protein [Thermoplasmata archaeon]